MVAMPRPALRRRSLRGSGEKIEGEGRLAADAGRPIRPRRDAGTPVRPRGDAGVARPPVDAAPPIPLIDAAVPPADATLIVDIRPWCDVTVDGTPRGRAGAGNPIRLAPGRHTVVCSQGPTLGHWSGPVNLAAGQTFTLAPSGGRWR
jgi:hypothetical protein